MKSTAPRTTIIISVDDDYADMMEYARSLEGQARIAQAQAEIDAGDGIVADEAYFDSLKSRRSSKR